MEAQRKLSKESCVHLDIQEYRIYNNMTSAKRTEAVPGDTPATILKEFLPELTTPVTAILKRSVKTHSVSVSWHETYKKQYHIPLKKIPGWCSTTRPWTGWSPRTTPGTVWSSKSSLGAE